MTLPTYDPTQPAFSNALDRLRPELEAIPGEELEPIRHDIVEAVVTALGVASTVKRHREEVRVEISESAALHIDRLKDSARACGHAYAQHLTQLRGTDTEQMVEELSQQRRVLLAEARSLVSQKRLSASVLAELVGGSGRKALCLDVLQLVAALRAVWASVESVTPVTVGELDHAEALANALATTLGENEHAMSPVSPSADRRQRAYTYFVRTYEEVRRAITFVRWDEGDADQIVPSLSAGRTRHDAPAPADAAPVQAPVIAAPVPTTNGAAPTTPGMPSAQPFTAPS